MTIGLGFGFLAALVIVSLYFPHSSHDTQLNEEFLQSAEMINKPREKFFYVLLLFLGFLGAMAGGFFLRHRVRRSWILVIGTLALLPRINGTVRAQMLSETVDLRAIGHLLLWWLVVAILSTLSRPFTGTALK